MEENQHDVAHVLATGRLLCWLCQGASPELLNCK